MRRIALLPGAIALLGGLLAAVASGQTDGEATPIYGIKIPPNYRNWTLISMANVGSPVNDIRAKLGNDLAMRAYREGKTSFPDGAIIARLAYQQVTSEENNKSSALLPRSAGCRPSR